MLINGVPADQELFHYCDVIMGAVASQTTSHTIVYSTVYSDSDQRKHFAKHRVTGLCVGNSPGPHKRPVTRKIFSFDDVIMFIISWYICNLKWGVLSQMHVSRAGASNYTPQILWGVISCSWPASGTTFITYVLWPYMNLSHWTVFLTH